MCRIESRVRTVPTFTLPCAGDRVVTKAHGNMNVGEVLAWKGCCISHQVQLASHQRMQPAPKTGALSGCDPLAKS
jgi:hypothetical protein